MIRLTLTILALLAVITILNAQEPDNSTQNPDLSSSDEILFTPGAASKYIMDILDMDNLWKPGSDSNKIPLTRLLEQYKEAYDSAVFKLSQTDYQLEKLHKDHTFIDDTLAVRWLNDSTFIIDTLELGREPLYVERTIIQRIIDTIEKTDTLEQAKDDSLPPIYTEGTVRRRRDTIFNTTEYVSEVIIDTAFLKAKEIQLYQIKDRRIVPKPVPEKSKRTYRFIPDGSKLIVSTPVHAYIATPESPFNIVPNDKMPDSLNAAVQTLLDYTGKRDSILIYINNNEGASKPFWLSTGKDELQRYWVRNHRDDSVSLWMGNPDRNNLSLALEDDILIDRIKKETIDELTFTMAMPKVSLAKIEPFKEIPIFWTYNFSTSFALSENFLSNWVQGGENSVSSLLDIQGEAVYVNKTTKTEWTTDGRLKLGSIIIEEDKEYDFRKNTDILEFNSKYNRGLTGKISLSNLFHMKNQLATGYNYPNDSVIISKFLNPGTFTIGAGIEYTPIKKSTINFSVLSYKNTFVLDTVNIDQTNHGIDEGKRANQEMGGQLLIENEFTFFQDLKVDNSLRLFSNYLDKPQNVDVEWEMELQKQISMYFTIVFNIHMIYDDDIRITELDENGDAVLLPDGSEKKTPKLQLKQFLGLTFIVKL